MTKLKTDIKKSFSNNTKKRKIFNTEISLEKKSSELLVKNSYKIFLKWVKQQLKKESLHFVKVVRVVWWEKITTESDIKHHEEVRNRLYSEHLEREHQRFISTWDASPTQDFKEPKMHQSSFKREYIDVRFALSSSPINIFRIYKKTTAIVLSLILLLSLYFGVGIYNYNTDYNSWNLIPTNFHTEVERGLINTYKITNKETGIEYTVENNLITHIKLSKEIEVADVTETPFGLKGENTLVHLRFGTNKLVIYDYMVPSTDFHHVKELKIISDKPFENLHFTNSGYSHLEKLTISAKEISKNSFNNYTTGIKNIYFENLEIIGENAFADAYMTSTKLIIPNTVTKISENAFNGAHFKEIVFEQRNSPIEINLGAFENCITTEPLILPA